MLIKNLFSLFGGSHQEGRSDNASPNVIEEKESIVIIPETQSISYGKQILAKRGAAVALRSGYHHLTRQ